MQSMPGAMWLVPNITAFDGRMPELPHSSLGDVVMLMHWTLDHKTGAAYPERRIMQVVRLHYRFQLGISLWHDPSTGAYEEDETGLCWGSFPKHCDTCDWVTGEDIWDYDLD
jgi:hypothetical protein